MNENYIHKSTCEDRMEKSALGKHAILGVRKRNGVPKMTLIPNTKQTTLHTAITRLNERSCGVDTIDRMKILVKDLGGTQLRYKHLIK